MELAAARQTMRIKDLKSTGYCVEFDDTTAKTYGRSSFESTGSEFWVENDVVFVKTYVIIPNDLQLSKNMAKRFRSRVWSPFLKYLNDPKENFVDYFAGGVVGLFKAKYNPNGTTLFEVVEVYKEKVPSMSTGFVRCTPWTLEYVGRNMEATCLHDSKHTLVYEYSSFKTDRCQIWVENGVVYVKTYATTPNVLQLPKDMAKRFRYRVWSPFLKYLNDPEDKFIDYFSGGLVGLIKAKYSPNGTTLFEVVDVYKKEVPVMGTGFVRCTPWTVEFIGRNLRATCLRDRENSLATNQLATVSDQDRQIGICFVADYINIAGYGQNKAPGVQSHCSYIFNRNLGVIRWIHKNPSFTDHPVGHVKNGEKPKEEIQDVSQSKFRLGKWVVFSAIEKQLKKEEVRKPGIHRITARKVEETSDQKKTRTTDGILEIEASFLFDHKELEDPENQNMGWVQRKPLLSKTAHFWDFDLGRVEIYPDVSKVILENIETHRMNLSETDRTKLKEEAIVVVVDARVHRNWMVNFKNYPEAGVFTTHRVKNIFYLDGGRCIFKQ
ncbi:hypothetical protein L3Y34_011866 [Caenorhabditis briggsae]|uniref:Uncharacterized protein n=1 Tax=Caenorhabditis briggsae TaxID=6238 RepID=A0AAE8ZSS1_CAEBR|nr:hypothetical protein L3Y34_011866 [Caenorhabditis briggsae]